MMAAKRFPDSFLWGVASSSFEIEGTQPGDGRGPSIWDTFCATPGKILDHSDGRGACDHYRRYPEDVAMMARLGVRAYRFSVAWPRIQPQGRGAVNQRGLDFYRALVDELLGAGIEPWLTLYHWDLPQALEDLGGWRNRDTAYAFADYTAVVADALKGQVKHWITHNEPWCVAVLGHRTGEHAPGLKDGGLALQAAHHVLLSHGLGMQRLRSIIPEGQHGITLNLTPSYATTDTAAALSDSAAFDGDFNRWYLDPVCHGRYPEDMQRYYERQGYIKSGGWSFIQNGDLALCAAPIDFLGVNFYTRAVFGQTTDPDQERLARQDPVQYTAMGWENYPQGVHDLFTRLHREYPQKAYYITENGAAYPDLVAADGAVHDPDRVRYYARHLEQVQRVCADGIPLQGYFAWSIMDNFEWAWGYDRRFGLVWVDYETQRRLPKDSFHWYQQVVHDNALPEHLP